MSNLKKQIIILSIGMLPFNAGYTQPKIHYNTQHLPELIYGQEAGNGFRISFSLVAMFTAGSDVRDGLRWGMGITLSQKVDNWTVEAGMDAYKAKQNFGLGTGFAGVQWDNQHYGGAYYLTHYFQDNPQLSGIVHIHLKEVQIRFEDDILAYPFTGFKIYDRYRTAAMEVRYKGFMLGTNIYTTDIDGLTDFSLTNSKGKYKNGKQLSSPLYAGYTNRDLLVRLGINNETGGWLGQNFWHKYLFQTPDFNTGNYDRLFFQLGIDKPYTLY